jgi:hypothetical protein
VNFTANCRGEGIVRERKTLTVKIPAGVDTGSNIRVRFEICEKSLFCCVLCIELILCVCVGATTR